MEKTRLSQEEWRRVEDVYHEALLGSDAPSADRRLYPFFRWRFLPRAERNADYARRRCPACWRRAPAGGERAMGSRDLEKLTMAQGRRLDPLR